jgi:hypothetical protein
MIFRRLHLVQHLNSSKADHSAYPAKKAVQFLSLCLLMIFGTFCAPTTSSEATLAASSTALAPVPSPIITETLVPTVTAESRNSIPVLAYYYIWFDPQSWNRAKTDYPLLGRYSSDDADVMKQHVQWAKNAGIDGFIVSWKSNEKLNRRLDQLIQIAEEENFKLAIIYEALNFLREPLPLEKVDADLAYFTERYREHHVFDLFEKPLLIWSGTWEFSTPEIGSVVEDKRDDILILASEKNVKGYQRLADLVDGNAYYWSSVNPDTHPGYVEKLAAMRDVIHESGGLWIAPAAPGFDARLVGGTRSVDRKEGETLQTQLNAALQSEPDAIGLISWNEFSENSHIEPSQDHGDLYLEVIAEILPLTLP